MSPSGLKAKNDRRLMLENLEKLKTEALNIYYMSSSGFAVGLVVYENVTGFIIRTLFEDLNLWQSALSYSAQVMDRSMTILHNLERNHPETLENNRKVMLKFGTLFLHLSLILVVLKDERNAACFKESKVLNELAELFVKCFDELKMVDPTSPMLKRLASVYDWSRPLCLPQPLFASASPRNISLLGQDFDMFLRKHQLYCDENQ